VEELAGFDVSDVDRYFQMIGFTRNILVEEHLLDEVLRTHPNLSQETHMILAFYLHEHLLSSILTLDES
jgi:hypothetical protein